MNVSGSFVGSRYPKTVDLFHQARLVRITHGTFAIWLDPFGMLDPKVLVNLLPELGVGVYLVRHGNWLGERFQVWRGRSTSFGAVSARRARVKISPKAACTRLRRARRRANWMAL